MLHNFNAAHGGSVLALLDAQEAVHSFSRWCAAWHTEPAAEEPDTILLQLHRANFELWHLEDQARNQRAADAAIAAVKRAIDRVNQRRNDLVEQHDSALLDMLKSLGLPNQRAPLHSEPPGLILDRLSILALKIFHTEEELMRQDVGANHVQRNRERLRVLQQQSSDLAACLSELWRQVCLGERQFKLYRQMKMYNDPELNPVLYRT